MYLLSMDNVEKEAVRAELQRFEKRKGKGSIGWIAKRTKLHRTTITKFRDGQSARSSSVGLIKSALEVANSNGGGAQMREDGEVPGNEERAPRKSALEILSSELRNLADLLDSTEFPVAHKVEAFKSFVLQSYDSIDFYVTLLEKRKDN